MAAAGPLLITILFLVFTEIRGEGDFAPGEGAGAARRTMAAFALYGAALLFFVIRGTWKSRGTLRKTVFAAVSLAASMFLMFLAFFSQMAP